MIETNRHNDATGLLQSLAQAQAHGSLANPTNVLAVLRHFAGEVLERFAAVGDGETTPQEAADADLAGCREAAHVFNGGSSLYPGVPDWNGRGLAALLRNKMGIPPGGSDEDVIAEAFGVFVHHLYDQLRALDETNEKEVRAAMDEQVRSFAGTLLGLDTDD